MDIFSDYPASEAPDNVLYQSLYTHIRQAILSGELKGGMKLPSTRALANDLHISRNTVLTTYRQLREEGYLEVKGGSGTFVAIILPESLLIPQNVHKPTLPQPDSAASASPVLSRRAMGQKSVNFRLAGAKYPRPFLVEAPALDIFPYKLWSRLVIRAARRMPVNHFLYQDASGYLPLREAIAAHAAITRQVHCTPEQVMIVPGAQAALDLAARVLVNEGDSVWLENPGYLGARGALLGSGAKIIPIPVDDEGLRVETGIERASQARMVYVTPSHQFPLGMTMSLPRRLALLEWAKSADAFILEDDYDSEFRYAGRPLATLQGLDDAGRVIYVGSFSKVLFPALRTGYLILPQRLVDPFRSVRRLTDFHNPMLEQTVLADFLNEGHFNRHLRRMRTVYAERRAAFIEAARELPLDIDAPEAGIHCVGWLPDGMDDLRIAARADDYNLGLNPISTFCLEPLERKGLILGYGSFSVPEIKNGVQRLGDLLRSF